MISPHSCSVPEIWRVGGLKLALDEDSRRLQPWSASPGGGRRAKSISLSLADPDWLAGDRVRVGSLAPLRGRGGKTCRSTFYSVLWWLANRSALGAQRGSQDAGARLMGPKRDGLQTWLTARVVVAGVKRERRTGTRMKNGWEVQSICRQTLRQLVLPSIGEIGGRSGKRWCPSGSHGLEVASMSPSGRIFCCEIPATCLPSQLLRISKTKQTTQHHNTTSPLLLISGLHMLSRKGHS